MKKLIIPTALALTLIVVLASSWAGPPPSSVPGYPGLSSDGANGLTVTGNVTAANSGVTPFKNAITLGSELAPTFAASPAYTTVAHGCTLTEDAGTMTVTGTSSGVNTFAPTTAITPVIGNTYRVRVTLTTFSAGQFVLSFGGVTEPAVAYNTTSGAGVYEFEIKASSTANLLITLGTSGTQTLTFTSVSVEQVGSYPDPQYLYTNNSGLAVPLTVYLPSSSVGMDVMVETIAAYAIYVRMQSADSIYVGTTAYTTQLLLGTARQTYVVLRCAVATAWDALGISGSVTPS